MQAPGGELPDLYDPFKTILPFLHCSVTLEWFSRCSAGLALLRGHSVDEGSKQGSVTGADRLGAAPIPQPCCHLPAASCPTWHFTAGHLWCEELTLIPQQAQ